MAEIRVLGAAELKQVLLLDDVLAGVQQAYLAKAQGKAETFPLVFHDFSPKAADMDIKSGHLGSEGVFGLKLVSFFEDNIRCGQAPLSALVALFSAGTGRPLAVLEGSALTGMRTGAAAALGAKYLARENSRVLLVVGAGHQCVYQVGAMLRAVPSVRRVLLHDAKTRPRRAKRPRPCQVRWNGNLAYMRPAFPSSLRQTLRRPWAKATSSSRPRRHTSRLCRRRGCARARISAAWGPTLPESRNWTAPFWPGRAYTPMTRPSALP